MGKKLLFLFAFLVIFLFSISTSSAGPEVNITLNITQAGAGVPYLTNTSQIFQVLVNISNTGNDTFEGVNLTISYNSSFLKFVNVTGHFQPNTTDEATGQLNWTNLSAFLLDPGNSTNFTINFSTINNVSFTAIFVDNITVINATAPATAATTSAANTSFGLEITRPGPNITVNKTLLTEDTTNTTLTVRFRITINNTGASNITVVNITDTFNATSMGFIAANLTPDNASNATGVLQWFNVTANLSDGNFTNDSAVLFIIEVNFTANQTSDVRQTNDANVTVQDQFLNTTTVNDSATVKITGIPNLSITKFLNGTQQSVSPQNTTSVITFYINFSNTGDTNITNITFNDTFRGGTLGFINSNTSFDNASNASGNIHFPNIVPLSSPIVPNGFQIVQVNFTVLSSSVALPENQTNNTVFSEAVSDAHNKTVTYLNPSTNVSVNVLNGTVNATTTAQPNITIVKTLESTASSNVTDIIVYFINLTNNGADNVTIVSITDNFNSTELGFLKSNITATNATNFTTGTDIGLVFFPNVTQGVALQANQSIVISLNFTAMISNISSNNTVQVNTFDIHNYNATSNTTTTTPNITDAILTITDDGPGTTSQLKLFSAQYVNLTDHNLTAGTRISGASCNISIEQQANISNMTGNSNNVYEFNLTLTTAGTFGYNVTCNSPGFNTLTASSSITITDVPTPTVIFRGRGGGGGGGGGTRKIVTACSDGIDNDGDGYTDLYDGGCDHSFDTDESGSGSSLIITNIEPESETPAARTTTRKKVTRALDVLDYIKQFYQPETTLTPFEILDIIKGFYEGS